MHLKQICLEHYRSYTDTCFDLGKHTIFIGPNGSGKTNVIEAIRTLSVTKSYRITQDREAIQWEAKYCRVVAKSDEETFEYILTREEYGTKKAMKRNGSVVPLTQMYGFIPTVLFSPETMRLIDGSPQERRRFLDTILSQADREYLEALMTYRKVMRERHYVLLRLQQNLGSEDELAFWDEELLKAGTHIITQREIFIDQMNTLLLDLYPKFIDPSSPERLVLHYKPATPAKDFAKKLKSLRSYDIKTASTNTGPHRDELVFLLADRDIMLFASRGELRRSILATKLAEAVYLHDLKGKEPIFLLDDVFSELDIDRRASFLEAIKDYHTVITTTDEDFVRDHTLEDVVIHRLPLRDHGLTQ